MVSALRREFLLLQQLLLRLAAGAARGAAGRSPAHRRRLLTSPSLPIQVSWKALPVMVTWEPLRDVLAENLATLAPDGALQPFSPLLALGKDVHGQGEAGDLLAGLRCAQLGVFAEATDRSDVQHFVFVEELGDGKLLMPVECPSPVPSERPRTGRRGARKPGLDVGLSPRSPARGRAGSCSRGSSRQAAGPVAHPQVPWWWSYRKASVRSCRSGMTSIRTRYRSAAMP